ncbi:hypothetical protein B484DRAFT_401613 [Ochromonadaceae sp. CCMP2298]|nr:hypothetical protein B484DRAFT_401613 [Ochromonadaceae sp. CCMP2298]
MDRAHRIGQTQPVTVYRLLAESTIEARIIGLQGLKEEIAAHVISGDRTQGLNAGGDSNNMGRALMDSVSLQFH